jgi:hypothetical protein
MRGLHSERPCAEIGMLPEHGGLERGAADGCDESGACHRPTQHRLMQHGMREGEDDAANQRGPSDR